MTFAIIGFLLAAPVVPSAAAEDLPVVVRTYDSSGVPEADRSTAVAAAAAILEHAGLSMRRLACEEISTAVAGHPCLAPLRAHELSVRLVRLPADGDGGTVTLGYSLLETQTRLGSLATVYVDRVADLASAAGIDLPTLLGRTIAHEIGHLLLGTSAHASVGIMRAVWSAEALQRGEAAAWRFTPRDAAAMRDAAARRRSAHPVQAW